MKNDCEYFMNLICSVLKNESTLDSISEIINPNFYDEKGNRIYHYLSEYSLEIFYKLNYNKYKNELIKEKKYKEIIKEYKNQIPLYIEILDELKCDIFSLNNMNQSPLIYSIIKKNYYISKAYLKKINDMNSLTENTLCDIFKLCINSGDCMRDDCIQLIFYILFLSKDKNIKIFKDNHYNFEGDNNNLFPSIIICKDFSKNIFAKFNHIAQMKSSNYYELYFGTRHNLVKQSYLSEILIYSKKYLLKFINEVFYPLLEILIRLEGSKNSNRRENIYNYLFIYLISFSFFNNISSFVKQKNININFQDKFGQTPLMYLINNREKIIKISTEIYYNTFEYLIQNEKIKIDLKDNNDMSAFGLCLFRINYLDAISLYFKFINNRLQFNSEILIFIINYINQPKEYKYIVVLLKIWYLLKARKKNIDFNGFNDFNSKNGRTLFHYINIFSPEDNTIFYIFKSIFFELIKLDIDINKKDIFKRNALFYFFIDENENLKNNDPSFKLELYLKNIKFDNLNDTDIYGNSLIFYAVMAKAYESIKLLLKYNVSLDIKNNNKNTIYSIATSLGDYKLLTFLYNIKKDNKIFLQEIYSSNQFKSKDQNVIQSLIDLYQKTNTPISKSQIIIEEYENIIEGQYLKNTKYFTNIIEPKSIYISDYLCLLNDEIYIILDENTKEIIIKDEYIKPKFFIRLKDSVDIKKNFNKDVNNLIKEINNEKSFILSENLFKYCKSKNYEQICEFMIKENYHLISICDDLVSLKNENELEYYIHQVLYEKDLLNYRNENNLTIFHILAKISKDLSFYTENKIDKYKISNLFDNLGNTPIYYACHKLNINFIETFSGYSFSSTNNDPQIVNYSLFIETNNNKTSPLKSLYFQINKRNNNILKLIIDISINTKKVYIIQLLLFLFKNYKNNYKDYFNLPYKDNLNNKEYLIKIIGLYTYYT